MAIPFGRIGERLRIFLTGPTGYIGGAVLDALLRAGHQVTGLVRDQPRARRLKKRGVEAVVGNLNDSAWRDAAVGFDALIHTALDSQRGPEADAKGLDTLFSAAQSTGGQPASGLHVRRVGARPELERG